MSRHRCLSVSLTLHYYRLFTHTHKSDKLVAAWGWEGALSATHVTPQNAQAPEVET